MSALHPIATGEADVAVGRHGAMRTRYANSL
jgi:hypothetical protein